MLRRSSPMRRTPLTRTGWLKRTAAKVKRPRNTGPDSHTRQLVWDRAGGWCEVPHDCNAAAVDLHHRNPRRMGGRRVEWINVAANLVAACRAGHDWIETHRAAALAMGLLLHSDEIPESVPVLTRHGLVMLDDHGNWREV